MQTHCYHVTIEPSIALYNLCVLTKLAGGLDNVPRVRIQISRLLFFLQEIAQIAAWNGIGDSAWLGERRLFQAFDQDHVDDSVNDAGIGIVQRAPAVAGICGSIELKYREGRLLELEDTLRIQTPGIGSRQNYRRNRRKHASMRDRMEPEHHAYRKSGKRKHLPFPSRPHQASLLSTDRVLVSTELDETITVIDRRTLRVVARLPTRQADSHTFAVSIDGTRLVTANVGPGSVSVIDIPSRTLLGVVEVAEKVNRICLEPAGRFAYTADQGSPRIAVIDTDLVEHVAWIELPSIGFGTAVTASGSHIVVALRTGSEIAVVDRRSGDVVHRVATPNHPQAIVLHPDGVRAYSACDADDCVVEVDIHAGRLLRRIETGHNPDGITWSPLASRPQLTRRSR